MFSIELFLFFKAALVGLSIAAPVGPIGLLCIQRTLVSGPGVGFISGLGAASADAIYGAIGAFGLTAVTQLFIEATTPLTLFGAAFLAWLGIKMISSQPITSMEDRVSDCSDKSSEHGDDSSSAGDSGVSIGSSAQVKILVSGVKAFASMFALTLSSPVTILSFVAVFAAISGSAELTGQSHSTAVVMVLGVFIGSACWWLMLTAGISRIRHKLDGQKLLWISRVAGGVLLSVAVYQLSSLVHHLF